MQMSTNPLEALLANDPNVAPAFKRLFANARREVRDIAFEKAQPRRFIEDAPVSAFADLESGDVSVRGSDRWQEVRAEEHADQLTDERLERAERNES